MKVTEVLQYQNKTAVVIPDSPLRIAGGGQPCDHGVVRSTHWHGTVTEVVEEQGKKIHVFNELQGTPQAGDAVTIELDTIRRAILTRMHTGEHVLFKAIKTQYPKLELEKIDLGTETSSIYVLHPMLEYSKLLDAEILANSIIRKNVALHETQVPKMEAIQFFDIRIKPERIAEEMVRVIEVKGFDKSACSGTHCQCSGEIESLFIIQINTLGNGRWQITFTVDPTVALKFARQTKEIAQLLNAKGEDVFTAVKNLQTERDSFKEKFRAMAREALRHLEPEEFKGLQFYGRVMVDMDTKILLEIGSDIMKKANVQNIPAVVLFVTEKQIFLSVSENSGKDANAILQTVFAEMGTKGGGKKNFSQGAHNRDPQKAFDMVKEKL